MSEKIRITIPEDCNRLDKLLARLMKERGVSRTTIQRIISSGGVKVDGEPASSSMDVRAGQKVTLELPEKTSREVVPLDVPLRILFQDESCLVLDKPAGMVVHPAKGHWEDTLVNALLGAGISLSSGFSDDRPGIVHRLDKDTSGALLIAKDNKSQAFLARQFKQRTIKKSYTALVWGALEQKIIEVDQPIGRDRANRKKMRVKADGRNAKTVFKLEEQLQHISQVSAQPETGRTHQIRVHLAYLHHPVVGDIVYGGHLENGLPNKNLRNLIKGAKRFFLHASSIEFESPVSGVLKVESPLPGEFRKVLEAFRAHE